MTDEAKRMGSKRMSPICSTCEALVVQSVVTKKSWALSVERCQLQVLQFWCISSMC